MAEKKEALPDYKTKRSLLYVDDATDYSYYGNLYLDEKRYSDALDFFERGADEEGLQQIKKIALKEGDFYLAARLAKIDSEMFGESDWENLARQAEALGKSTFAKWAREKLPGHEPEEESSEEPEEE